MGSSNRHWPSLFKSKLTSHNQWVNNPTARNPYTQTQGGFEEERSPEAKARWNPRPEQIRILEGIFNSGMVNPARDEIKRIRAQLQEFGQVGDANVFYWFQNRKSRSKHKHRHPQSSKSRPTSTKTPATSSSSSSSNSKSNEKTLALNPLNSPTTSVNHFFFFPQQQGLTQAGFCFPDNVGNCLVGDVMHKTDQDDGTIKPPETQITFTAPTPSVLQPGLVEPKSTVFINDVSIEVATGVGFNVREAFGDDAVLVQSWGEAVPTDELGVTQHPLQHGAFYYLLHHSFAPSHNHPLDLEEK